jgi:hypothetical protein
MDVEQLKKFISENSTESKDMYVTFKIIGEYTVHVNAETVEDALKKGEEEIGEIYFGDLDFEENEALYIEDIDGNKLWNNED